MIPYPTRNREGLPALDIDPEWWRGLTPGLSALVRLRNEAVWCRRAIESVLPWVDEVVVAVQPSQDGTLAAIRALAQAHGSRVRVVRYPATLWPMGPGHDRCPADSVRACAWYYNFTQSQARFDHALKWDGDMVAQDDLGARLRALMAAGHRRIKLHGTDLVGEDLRHIGCHPACPSNGVYPLGPEVGYVQGPVTQSLRPQIPPTAAIEDAFLHLKWARKPIAAATQQWPEDWHRIEHFRRIVERRRPVARYAGRYPASIAALLAVEDAERRAAAPAGAGLPQAPLAAAP